MFTAEDNEMRNNYELLQNLDVRYFVVVAWEISTAQIYFGARKYGLVSPNHVWISITTPAAEAGKNLTSVYGENAFNDMIGFIAFYRTFFQLLKYYD
jgi:hypothetical protein